ncbi:MAG: transketolase [Candidatus Omnitrophota bacterium]
MTNMIELQKTSDRARELMVDALIGAGCGHPGGAFSSIDMMTALFFEEMKIDPLNPKWEERDRFILSKGHSSVGLYAIMHLRGFFSKDVLMTFRQDNSILAGHPDMNKVPGVEMSTGSLGHGLSVGVGYALAAKMDRKPFRTFVMVGDGESQEGSVWEAAMSASHFKLDNLIAIVDRNRFQIDGPTEDIMSLEPYKQKWDAFGWQVREINGNEMGEIVSTLKEIPFSTGKPSLIISNTIKGKGISFMENKAEWHGKALKGEQAELARLEIRKKLESY